MPVTIQIYEDTGAVLASKGTTRSYATNCNWKRVSTSVVLDYHIYPLRRPEAPEIETDSYTKYLFFKVSGTYTTIKNFKISVSGVPGKTTNLYYKMSNVYQEPSNVYDGSLMYLNGGATLYPNISSVGPEAATTRPLSMDNNVAFYTGYLVTQLRVLPLANPITVPPTVDTTVGNTNQITISFTFDEFEE